jgi:hypothetical protein
MIELTAQAPVVPEITNWPQAMVIMMPGLLAFGASIVMGILNGRKTDDVRGQLNGELAKHKAELLVFYDKSVQEAIATTRSVVEKEGLVISTALEGRIRKLEDQLQSSVSANSVDISRIKAENVASINDRAALHALIEAAKQIIPPAAIPPGIPVMTAPVVVMAPESPEKRLEEIRGQS